MGILFDHLLKTPSYGYDKNGEFYRPTYVEILRETLSNSHIFRSKKNWIGFFTITATCYWAVPLSFWFLYPHYFTWQDLLLGFFIGFFLDTVLEELYLHRYLAHRSFEFKNKFWRFFFKYLNIKGLPEEVHIPAHVVHHKFSDKVNDPYNAAGGKLYCFFADINHQRIRDDLTPKEYEQVKNFLSGEVLFPNSYESYQKWGSVSHPLYFTLERWVQWSLLSVIYYFIGGFPLIYTVFGMKFLQVIFVIRMVNYHIHGCGKKLFRKDKEFGVDDYATNNAFFAYLGTNWHDHHHHFPKSANTAFFWWQIDWPYLLIRCLYALGIVKSYVDLNPSFQLAGSDNRKS